MNLSKKTHWKRWISQNFYSNASRILVLLMSSQDVQNSVFFEKRDVFFENNLQVFKNTQHGYFPSESVSKVFLAYATSKSSKLEIFRKNDIFLEKFLEGFPEHYTWHFLSRLRVSFSKCLGILEIVKILGFSEK